MGVCHYYAVFFSRGSYLFRKPQLLFEAPLNFGLFWACPCTDHQIKFEPGSSLRYWVWTKILGLSTIPKPHVLSCPQPSHHLPHFDGPLMFLLVTFLSESVLY